MKKLFILGSFLTVILFISGCQTDTPVQADETTVTLEKPAPFFQLEFVAATNDLPPRVVGVWGSYGGAKSWKAYHNDKADQWHLIGSWEAVKGQNVLTFDVDVTGWSSGAYNFQISAYDGKDNLMGYWGQNVDIP